MHDYLCDNGVVGQGHHVNFAAMDDTTAQSVASMMQALATPSRVRILSQLASAPRSVTELAHAVDMSQPAVSQQLRVLRFLGLVVGNRDGRRIVYSLHNDHVRALLSEAISHTEHLRLGRDVHSELKALSA